MRYPGHRLTHVVEPQTVRHDIDISRFLEPGHDVLVRPASLTIDRLAGLESDSDDALEVAYSVLLIGRLGQTHCHIVDGCTSKSKDIANVVAPDASTVDIRDDESVRIEERVSA